MRTWAHPGAAALVGGDAGVAVVLFGCGLRGQLRMVRGLRCPLARELRTMFSAFLAGNPLAMPASVSWSMTSCSVSLVRWMSPPAW